MPNSLAIGVDYKLFWHLNPKKLKAFYKADEISLKRRDAEMWHMGQYILSAVSVATDHCLNGRKARSQYIEKPFMSSIFDNSNSKNTESNEEVAVFEMKKRTNYLKKSGLFNSPS